MQDVRYGLKVSIEKHSTYLSYSSCDVHVVRRSVILTLVRVMGRQILKHRLRQLVEYGDEHEQKREGDNMVDYLEELSFPLMRAYEHCTSSSSWLIPLRRTRDRTFFEKSDVTAAIDITSRDLSATD